MNNKEHLGDISYEQRAAWGREGGLQGKREDKVRAGKISAAMRDADKPRCPTCLRIIKPAIAAQLAIRTVKVAAPD